MFHINKEGFLLAFKDAFFNIFIIKNCKKAFKVLGLVPINAAVILNRLNIRLRTPLGPVLLKTLWQSKTLSNTLEFRSQSKLIHDFIA